MEHETRRSHQEIKKPFWKSWKFWTVFIVIVLLVAGISSCVNEFKKELASPSTRIYKLNSNKSVKAMLKHYEPDLKVTEVGGVYADPKSKTVLVTIKEDSSVDDKYAVKTMHADIASVWKAFKKSKGNDFANIAVIVTYPFDDAGGNTHQLKAMTADLDGSRLNDLNLEGFSDSNVSAFATEYWQRNDMPSIK
ncbi:hypothetical protein GKD24_00500 [Lactobacillus paracasei]|uniref:hypothetical protein n=1 Tax=Lacticaseibacillus paracasei TaxID=1597 RepID=UPI000D39CB08|nr:hypothetical protein [Lacticaseibacillus paracasei]PTS56332.1 hypothetical protein DBQ61_09420 [Lactobacillus sp. DS22_6]MBX4165160.1 hypothetical protein [Lacticaseibacillus paracasei]MCZ2751490.1 hypothetical protein [Lacticaseibacillus paracasei]MCZ2761889.1 hypothetical protein [Lacticaseibacillus paracasei]MCZ2770310.1 hypothetical protein [Lacticaseibacillus paracasei]